MAWETETHLPQLLASLVCDDVALSERDGRVSLQRVFFDVGAAEFPALLERLAVVNFWSGGQGVFNVAVELAGPGPLEPGKEDLPAIARGEVRLEMRPQWMTNVHLLNLEDVEIPQPGVYAVTIHLDGAVVHGYDLLVVDLRTNGEQEQGASNE